MKLNKEIKQGTLHYIFSIAKLAIYLPFHCFQARQLLETSLPFASTSFIFRKNLASFSLDVSFIVLTPLPPDSQRENSLKLPLVVGKYNRRPYLSRGKIRNL